MITSIIRWSIGNRFFVLLATFLLVGIGGTFPVQQYPLEHIRAADSIQSCHYKINIGTYILRSKQNGYSNVVSTTYPS